MSDEPAWQRTRETLPEYNNHGDVLNEYWPRLTEERPDFQFHLTGDDDEILARARSIPLRWMARWGTCPPGSTARSRVASTSPALTCPARW